MALMSTLVDTFNSGINGSLWTAADSSTPSSVTAVSGGVQMAHGAVAEYQALRSVDTALTLTASSGYVQVTDYGNQSLISHEFYFQMMLSGFADGIFFVASSNQLSAFKKVSGTQTQIGSSIALSTTTHKWLRMRESAGTTFWDTAPDGTTWTNRWSVANPVTLTALQVAFAAGGWQTEATATQIKLDNFNTLGAVANTGQFFAMF